MSTDVVLPFASADFLFSPTDLPDPGTDLETFLSACQKRVNWMICEAWEAGALPARTALVHCLTKPPLPTQVDFNHPAILKRPEQGNQKALEDRLCLLGCYMHTTWHLLTERASSHQRAREHGDVSRGAVIVFTKELPQSQPLQSYSHILHFGYQRSQWPPAPDFSDCRRFLEDSRFDLSQNNIPRFSRAYEAFDAVAFLDHAKAQQWPSITVPIPAPADWDGLPRPALNAVDPWKIVGGDDSLFEDIRGDKRYRDRVAITVSYGAIILCLPQTFSFPDGHAKTEELLDSGLTILLRGDEPPTSQELNQVRAVARKVSGFIGSTYGLAKALARHEVALTTELIAQAVDHELNNATTNVSAILEKMARQQVSMTPAIYTDIAARLNTARTALAALTEIARPNTSLTVSEQFRDVVQNFQEYSDYTLKVEVDSQIEIRRIELPSTFRLLLSELIRNAYKQNPVANHWAKNRVADVVLKLSHDDLTLRVTNPAEPDAQLHWPDQHRPAPKEPRGLELVARLCKELRAKGVAKVSRSRATVTIHIPIYHL